jgi:hypothetical protein
VENLPNGVRGVELGKPPTGMSAVTLADAPMSPTARDRYRVTVVFRHPIQAAGFSDEQLKELSAEGDSALRIPAGRTTFVAEDPQVEGGELRMSLEANTAGRLGRAVAELTVDGAPLARRIVTTHLGAILARLAFETDALVVVHWVEVVAGSTGHTERGFIYRGDDSILERWPEWKHHEPDFFRSAYAVYRDGLNSTNPFWSLLCFIRVIEGVLGYRAKAMKLARERGLNLVRPTLELQDDPMIVHPFRDWIGKKVFWVAGQLHTEFRVPLAHGVSPDESMQAADQIGVESRHWLARPVAHQVARALLRDAREIRDMFGTDALPELDRAALV